MFELLIVLAALSQDTQDRVQQREDPPIDVRGRRVRCRTVNPASAQSRLGGQRVCMTRQEEETARDLAYETIRGMRCRPDGGSVPRANCTE